MLKLKVNILINLVDCAHAIALEIIFNRNYVNNIVLTCEKYWYYFFLNYGLLIKCYSGFIVFVYGYGSTG